MQYGMISSVAVDVNSDYYTLFDYSIRHCDSTLALVTGGISV
jgi:hypothetical protein